MSVLTYLDLSLVYDAYLHFSTAFFACTESVHSVLFVSVQYTATFPSVVDSL